MIRPSNAPSFMLDKRIKPNQTMTSSTPWKLGIEISHHLLKNFQSSSTTTQEINIWPISSKFEPRIQETIIGMSIPLSTKLSLVGNLFRQQCQQKNIYFLRKVLVPSSCCHSTRQIIVINNSSSKWNWKLIITSCIPNPSITKNGSVEISKKIQQFHKVRKYCPTYNWTIPIPSPSSIIPSLLDKKNLAPFPKEIIQENALSTDNLYIDHVTPEFQNKFLIFFISANIIHKTKSLHKL